MYIVESDFNYKGYRCVTIFTDMGHRCGYVGLPEGHHLYGKGYDDTLNFTYKDCHDLKVDKMSPINWMGMWFDEEENNMKIVYYFNVHGGITYINGGKDSKYPVESDLWWFGFDCGHYLDAPDTQRMYELWPDNEYVLQRIKDEEGYYSDPRREVRTCEYVQDECKSMVEQFLKLDDIARNAE